MVNDRYKVILDQLFNMLPMYQKVGAAAYKEDLTNSRYLDQLYGNPHRKYRVIHVAGTNGKGSVSHILASILQSAGFRVGLYTSPHLIDFRERIRVDGEMISEESVIEFWEQFKVKNVDISPSFFELTVAMAFKHFADQEVDYAIVEVGLGGRLDSTNIVTPELSIITNIGLDHQSILGDTKEQIAREKAGVIKRGVPVVIGDSSPDQDSIYGDIAKELDADLNIVRDLISVKKDLSVQNRYVVSRGSSVEDISCDLNGDYQEENIATAIVASGIIGIDLEIIKKGISAVVENTGFKGRWQTLSHNPTVICDTGHNLDGVGRVVEQLNRISSDKIIVWGMVADKDLDPILALLPKDAYYIFCKADNARAVDSSFLLNKAEAIGLKGIAIDPVVDALAYARSLSEGDKMVFVGGSTFVVAEVTH